MTIDRAEVASKPMRTPSRATRPLAQEAGLVPVVEPEVLIDGDHTVERCREVTEHCLQLVFEQLRSQRVLLEARMILKPNMVLPGLTCPHQETVDEVATATLKCLLEVVPAAVPGIAFLSGGQSGELASARLNAMHPKNKLGSPLPWALEESDRDAAQQALLHRAHCNRVALQGDYSAAMERG